MGAISLCIKGLKGLFALCMEITIGCGCNQRVNGVYGTLDVDVIKGLMRCTEHGCGCGQRVNGVYGTLSDSVSWCAESCAAHAWWLHSMVCIK